ncbi:Uncharacterized SPBc2 prophage-derived protein YoqJ [Alkalibacterium putridalgicola]|uniref:UPF0398 protein APU01nite_23970 n=1 Tax=Alkalibacterium putridalgicola TaxID=426703 RepID=A0A1H7XTR5_9LACT|nr:DUF1273 domain-containing protein [Alkalibacterium putridalgicola]GEK90358.1 UPF0398 protein [Alkalibacterium putridalgicola]SEM37121.1 Uncharacterized SPBc2 prophage-derived protein YoqJ [Alkalibacterium putridalgicola]
MEDKFIKNLYVSGYRSYELSIFQADDPKIDYIKKFFKRKLIEYIEEGLEWVIISGNLGTELWMGEVALDLKGDYPELRLAVLLPYTNFSSKWNEVNQMYYNSIIERADYINYTSNQDYANPGQLKNNQAFIVKNTDGCLLFYDSEHEGKVGYFYEQALKYQERHPYEIETTSFDELQWFITDLLEEERFE